MLELQERLEHEQRFDVGLINGVGRGRPKSGAFVNHVRCLLATGLNLCRCLLSFFVLSSLLLSAFILHVLFRAIQGCSARAARDEMLVSGAFYMAPKKFEQFRDQVPHLSWFKTQRKGLTRQSSSFFSSCLTFSCLVVSPS